jgi:hypothetical protein
MVPHTTTVFGMGAASAMRVQIVKDTKTGYSK